MAQFALIDPSNKICQIDPETFPVAPPLVWSQDISSITPAPQVGWTATDAGGAWTFAAPSAPPVDFARLAMAELDKSDITIVRCYEHGVPVPAEWVTYRTALRAIVAGDVVTSLPTVPAYPAGT